MQTYIDYIMHIRYIYIQQTHKKVQPSHSAALPPDAAHMEVNTLDFWCP